VAAEALVAGGVHGERGDLHEGGGEAQPVPQLLPLRIQKKKVRKC